MANGKVSPEDFIKAFTPQPLNEDKSQEGYFERGYFNPSESMKSLNDEFIKELTKRLKEEYNVTPLVKKQISPMDGQVQLLFAIPLFEGSDVAEVYELNNNGIEASWSFQGKVKIR